MGWEQDIERQFTIRTGEGSEFVGLLWKGTQARQTFNLTEFEFIGTRGTLIERRQGKSNSYKLEWWFQGQNHLEQRRLFDEAASDPRPWFVDHPFHGALSVQPLSIDYNLDDYNLTKVTCNVKATIDQQGFLTEIAPFNTVITEAASVSEVTATAFEDVQVTASNVTTMRESTTDTFERYSTAGNTQGLRNILARTNAAIDNALVDPVQAIRQTQALINAPFQFIETVETRFQLLLGEFNTLIESAINVASFDYFRRRFFESQSTALIGAMCVNSVTNPDYNTRAEVFAQGDAIEDVLNRHITKLDELQGGDNFTTNSDVLRSLEDLVRFTALNLERIAMDARQERTHVVTKDTNLIVLAHRLYGLDLNPNAIDQIINTNTITADEILEIKAGRRITYYV